jgi:fructokinase
MFRQKAIQFVTRWMMEIILVLVCIYLAFAAPNFLTANNLLNVLRSVSMQGIIAFGITMVIISREIDLSIGSAVAFSGCLIAWLMAKGTPFAAAFAITLLAGGSIGVLTGLMRAWFQVPSFITTLALYTALQGGALMLIEPFSEAIRFCRVTGPIRPSLRDFEKMFEMALPTVETVGYFRSSLTGLHAAIRDYFRERLNRGFEMQAAKLFAGVEAGGTKFVCGVGRAGGGVLERYEYETTQPEETLRRGVEYFHRVGERLGAISAVGIATFGPADLDPASPTYGQITTTPKPGWPFTPILKALSEGLGVPGAIDTDVNAAALAEMRYGAGRDCESLLYITVGTGIGGGFAQRVGERIVTRKGRFHPEMGHVLLPRMPGDTYGGHCPYHENCLEGFACGPALGARWKAKGQPIPADHPAWSMEAGYLARGLASLIFTLAPDRIVLGGGVMRQEAVWPLLLEAVARELNAYALPAAILTALDEYIVRPGLGQDSGLIGSLALAEAALEHAEKRGPCGAAAEGGA